MKMKTFFAVVILPAILLFSCGGGGTAVDPTPKEPTGNYQLAKSDIPREPAASVDQDTISIQAKNNSQFAFDLYNQIKGEPGNLFYSPYSISVALAMTYAGTDTTSEQQIADVFHFTQGQDITHRAFSALDLQLNTQPDNIKPEDRFTLNVVNSIWGEKSWTFLDPFLDTLAKYYGAGLRLVDFAGNPEASRIVINDWVKTMTKNKIPELIAKGMVDDSTVMVLVNAIYFKAKWMEQFEKDATQPGDFNKLDGSKVSAPMMSNFQSLKYVDEDGWSAVEIPYKDPRLSMVIILPDKGNFENFENSLDWTIAEKLPGYIENPADTTPVGESKGVQLTMPKFEYDATLDMADFLKAMGMPDPFEPGIADFSRMDGSHDLYIQWIIHKAYVKVDEEGTEAAAATGVGVGFTSAPLIEVDFKVDRPFLFVIRDNRASGSILFVGRVLDPTE